MKTKRQRNKRATLPIGKKKTTDPGWRNIEPPDILDAAEFMPKIPLRCNRTLLHAELGIDLNRHCGPISERSFAMGSRGFTTSEVCEAEESLYQGILKIICVPSLKALKGKYFNRFRKWCTQHGLDPDTQTTSGKAFAKYVQTLENAFQAKQKRLTQVRYLFKVIGPMWTSAEAVQEDEEKNGWNRCLMDYIDSGKVPDKEAEDQGNLYARAQAIGLNQARKKLLEKK